MCQHVHASLSAHLHTYLDFILGLHALVVALTTGYRVLVVSVSHSFGQSVSQ